jgi:hypothetical protein
MQEAEKFVSYKDYFHTVQIHFSSEFNLATKCDENCEEM